MDVQQVEALSKKIAEAILDYNFDANGNNEPTEKSSVEKVIKESVEKINDEEATETIIEIKEKKEDKEKEAVMIALAGVKKGCGNTHITIQCAEYLAKMSYDVAILDFSGNKIILGAHYNSHVIYYPDATKEILDKIAFMYDFILLDMGVFPQCDRGLFRRGGKKIIVSGAKPWEIDDIHDVFEAIPHYEAENYTYIFNHVPIDWQDRVQEGMEPIQNVIFAEYNPNPWRTSGTVEKIIFSDYELEQKPQEKIRRKKICFRKKQK